MRRPTTDKEIAIARIVAEKEEELDEEDMIVVSVKIIDNGLNFYFSLFTLFYFFFFFSFLFYF